MQIWYLHCYLFIIQLAWTYLLPYPAFTGFRDAYEEPEMVEGFSQIKRVNWVFEGTEEEKSYWSMWLQIDGK